MTNNWVSSYAQVYKRASSKRQNKNNQKGAGIVAHRVKPLLAMPVPHIGVPIQVPVALLLIQLSDNAPGKAGEDDPSIWAPATHGVPGS